MIRTGPTPNRGKRTGTARLKPVPGRLAVLRVASLPGQRSRGRVIAGQTVIACALGPAGIVRSKREGDGATPAGSFRLSSAFVRIDRIGHRPSGLPLRRVAPTDGWCDDAGSALYNRPVTRPFKGGHERLWRDDTLYDCIVVIDYNRTVIRKGLGSAIFLHVATPELKPTAGCVALPRPALLRLLPRLGPHTRVLIGTR